jgi:hypothetical protein
MAMKRLALLVVVALHGCHRPQPEPELPGYTITIPADVPEQLVLTDKDGTQHTGNGRELYAGGHKYGWQRCWDEHQRGRLDLRNDSAYENYIPQAYGIEVRGFADGFKGYQAYLRTRTRQ